MSLAHHHHDDIVPARALKAAFLLIGFVLLLTAAVRIGWLPQSADPVAQRTAANVGEAASRSLVFSAAADGTMHVRDAASGAPVALIAPDKGGFLRQTVKRLGFIRAQKGVAGADPALRLVKWDNGALTLEDPATGTSAELQGFGSDHTQMFAAMLAQGGA